MSILKFELPNAQTPGYLKRMRSAIEYNKKIKSREPLDPEIVDDMVDFLLPYIKEPEDREEARKLMFDDLTEEQFSEMLDALSGKEKEGEKEEEAENPTVPKTPSASSEPSEKAEKE